IEQQPVHPDLSRSTNRVADLQWQEETRNWWLATVLLLAAVLGSSNERHFFGPRIAKLRPRKLRRRAYVLSIPRVNSAKPSPARSGTCDGHHPDFRQDVGYAKTITLADDCRSSSCWLRHANRHQIFPGQSRV